MTPWARTEPSEKEGMVELIVADKMIGYIFTEDADRLLNFLNAAAVLCDMAKEQGLTD